MTDGQDLSTKAAPLPWLPFIEGHELTASVYQSKPDVPLFAE